MPHIKLTETFYIDSESIDIIELSGRDGKPWVDVWTKRQDWYELHFRGDQATETWNNWTAYMQRAEDERRGSAPGAVPEVESHSESEENASEDSQDW